MLSSPRSLGTELGARSLNELSALRPKKTAFSALEPIGIAFQRGVYEVRRHVGAGHTYRIIAALVSPSESFGADIHVLEVFPDVFVLSSYDRRDGQQNLPCLDRNVGIDVKERL